MAERRATGPEPLPGEVYRTLLSVLKTQASIPQGQKRNYSDDGTFFAELFQARRLVTRKLFWTEQLLKYHNDNFHLRISGYGNLLVYNEGNNLVEIVEPKDIRIVDQNYSSEREVMPSGFVLGRYDRLALPTQIRRLETLEKMLVDAEAGKIPEQYSFAPFVKVLDPKLVSKRVSVIRFDLSPVRYIGNYDNVVVVDSQKKTLLEREVVYPLDPRRWQQPSSGWDMLKR